MGSILEDFELSIQQRNVARRVQKLRGLAEGSQSKILELLG